MLCEKQSLQCHYRLRELHKCSQHLFGGEIGLNYLETSSPLSLQWLNECGEIKVTRQVLVALSIGKYEDEVLCDVVTMHACHLLLGRP
jgi:hypothetical protein